MIDATLVEGALILLGGMAAGWVGRGRSERRRGPTPARAATCGCGHVRAMHVDGKGHCTEVEVDYEWIGATGNMRKERVELPCACKIYDGPEPLNSYYAPEITP